MTRTAWTLTQDVCSDVTLAVGSLPPPEPLLFTRHLSIALSPTLEAGHDASGASCVTALNPIAELAMQEDDFAELRHCALPQCAPAEILKEHKGLGAMGMA